MAIRRRRHKHGARDRKKHVDELSAQLAPLEELMPELVQPEEGHTESGHSEEYHDATIRVDRGSVPLPENLIEAEGTRSTASTFKLEPVIVVILVIMLSWIAFIAWLITRMPARGNEGTQTQSSIS